jgi:WD40 repeat protein
MTLPLHLVAAIMAVALMATSPDGSRLAMGNVDSANISIWDLRQGKLQVNLGGHVSAVLWFC